MKHANRAIELKLTRTIPATPAEAFDGWLDPRCPGTPWQLAAKLIFNPVVDGLYYWLMINDVGDEKPHYGRFTIVDRPSKVQYTWGSPHTRGMESLVTVTFAASGDHTLLTLTHENLTDDDFGRGHDHGWQFLLNQFASGFQRSD